MSGSVADKGRILQGFLPPLAILVRKDLVDNGAVRTYD